MQVAGRHSEVNTNKQKEKISAPPHGVGSWRERSRQWAHGNHEVYEEDLKVNMHEREVVKVGSE